MAIVKMKRLRLIGMAAERDELLRQLQRVGCVEIDEPEDHGTRYGKDSRGSATPPWLTGRPKRPLCNLR